MHYYSILAPFEYGSDLVVSPPSTGSTTTLCFCTNSKKTFSNCCRVRVIILLPSGSLCDFESDFACGSQTCHVSCWHAWSAEVINVTVTKHSSAIFATIAKARSSSLIYPGRLCLCPECL